MTSYDDVYLSDAAYFGDLPDPSLVAHFEKLDITRPMLDIGCGQGRHALFLARRGAAVDALDPSMVAVEHVRRAAAEENLHLEVIHGTFRDLKPADGTYGTVLVYGLIPMLSRADIHDLTNMVTSALRPRGLLLVTAFGTWDPAYPRHATAWHEVGENSFRGPDGDLRSYLEPGELRRLFADFEVVHAWEGLGPEHRHGGGAVERHGLVEAVLRR